MAEVQMIRDRRIQAPISVEKTDGYHFKCPYLAGQPQFDVAKVGIVMIAAGLHRDN
jgi:hypothetical protein